MDSSPSEAQITGCDTTSAPFGKGKRPALQIMQVNKEVSEEIQVFNKVEASYEETAKQVKPSSWQPGTLQKEESVKLEQTSAHQIQTGDWTPINRKMFQYRYSTSHKCLLFTGKQVDD